MNPLTMPRGYPIAPPQRECNNVAAMSTGDKYLEAIRRSDDKLAGECKAAMKTLVSAQNAAIVSGTLVFWGASHLFGLGEAIDVILLGMGILFTGAAAIEAGQDLAKFVMLAKDATSVADLEQASVHFARAFTEVTMTVISFWLLKRQVGPVVKRATGPGSFQPRIPNAGPAPVGKVKIKFRSDMKAGSGKTSWYGDITISTQGTLEEYYLTYFHEQFHSFLSPRFGPLKELRAGLRANAYLRSAIMKYLEETMAEAYAHFRVKGISVASLKAGINFPIANNYVTVSQLAVEGAAIGTISIEAQMFQVYLLNMPQDIPASMDYRYEDAVCR